MQFGASFSHPHLEYLEIDPIKAVKSFKTLGLKWIRLGCYWSEIESEKGEYDFSKIDPLVEYCDRNGVNVVMTIGMKAPRWPEFYIPEWLNFSKRKFSKITKKETELHKETLKFVRRCLSHFKSSPSIKVWQVENEPLDYAGEILLKIDPEFLKDEVDLVRKIDKSRPILINPWGGLQGLRSSLNPSIDFSNIVGLDIYLKHPIPLPKLERIPHYINNYGKLEKYKKVADSIINKKRKFWIAELQAEPWEPEGGVTERDNPPSFLPEDFQNNIKFAKELSPEVALLWGFEYWLWRKEKFGDSRYLKQAKSAINKFNN